MDGGKRMLFIVDDGEDEDDEDDEVSCRLSLSLSRSLVASTLCSELKMSACRACRGGNRGSIVGLETMPRGQMEGQSGGTA